MRARNLSLGRGTVGPGHRAASGPSPAVPTGDVVLASNRDTLIDARARTHTAMSDYDALVTRLAFLATASEILASSLDITQTMQDLAHLVVPTLGDLCIVDVLEDDVLRRVATAHVDPAKAHLVDQLRRRYPLTADSPQPAARALRSGELHLLEEVTPALVAAHAFDEAHAQLIIRIGIRSHLAVPLVARGTTIGVISLGITESDRRYGEQDVALARDLSRRAALAIDNARLYELAQSELARRAPVEEALRFSEERFRAIVDQSPLSTQVLSPDGYTLRVNPAWEKLWGLTLAHVATYNVLSDPQLDAHGITALLRRALAGESVSLPAIRYDPNQTALDSDGGPFPVRWVRAFAYPVKAPDGRVREVVLIHEDVTAAREAQEQLRVSEERLRLALQAGRMNVWDWNLITDVVECSENAREFWNRDVGRAADFLAVVHPDDLHAVEEAGRAALDGPGPYFAEYRLRRAQGDVRWVQSRGRVDRDADGRPLRILGVTTDVTDLKVAEETTRLLADAGGTLGTSLDYHTTLRNLTRLLVPRLADWCAVDLLTDAGALERVAVHHVDPARVALADDLFRRYPPRPTDEVGTWHVLRTGEPEWMSDLPDRVLEHVAQDASHLALLRQLELRSFISVPLVARGSAIGVLTLVHADSGRRYKASDVALAVDVARRAAASVENAQLYQRLREEDRRKDEFLATLAHELRNPLAPIRTGLALLRRGRDPEVLDATRVMMERQVTQMVRLIDDLLDLSRVTRGHVELERTPTDLGAVVATAVETSRPLLDEAAVTLEVQLPDHPVVLDADPTRMAQVLSNLLNNAAKFTEPGGRVTLHVGLTGTHVLMRVTDTGAGIAPHMLARIFEMFAQGSDSRARRHGGLGIGLTLVRRLVELHGGRVWAESAGPGHGSSFLVQLPHAADAVHDAPSPVASDERLPTVVGRRVLVVDDNVDAAEAVEALLSLAGHEVRTAFSGTGALGLLATFSPDIAFLDIGLPDMSGHTLAREMRADGRWRDVTLVAVTGWGQEEHRRQSREAGFDLHLTKPVDAAEMLALVNECPVR